MNTLLAREFHLDIRKLQQLRGWWAVNRTSCRWGPTEPSSRLRRVVITSKSIILWNESTFGTTGELQNQKGARINIDTMF